jgi:hypothetical protein
MISSMLVFKSVRWEGIRYCRQHHDTSAVWSFLEGGTIIFSTASTSANC